MVILILNIFTLKRVLVIAAVICATFAASAQSYNNIEFIENKGQWDSRVKYMGEVSNGAFYIREGGVTIVQHNPVDFANIGKFLHGLNPDNTTARPDQKLVLRSHAFNVDFVGASPNIKSVPSKIIPSYNNYFIGGDQSKWAGSCRIYQAITLENVYPNVDVRYYTDNNFLKYDIIVKPGGDVSKIALRYDGTDKIQVKNKQLALFTSVGELAEGAPYTYQARTDKLRKEVSCKYVVKDNIVTFDVKNYDPTETLVIDPQVIFCSFSGSRADNWGFTATYGADGSLYGGGIVFNTGTYPTSLGAFQTTFQGGGGAGIGPGDIGIIKLSPDGSTRMYATYIGGSGNEQPHSLIVDNQGNLILAGRTNSPNYPVLNNGNLNSAGTDIDIVVTKLNATGTGLIGSRKIGGTNDDGVNIASARGGINSLQRNYGDDGRSEVILDGAGNVYVASSTQSSNFPVTAGVFQNVNRGGANNQDGVLLKFTPNLNALTFASYIGGTGNDAAYVLSLAPNGNIYVAGGTESTNFLPGTQTGTVGPANHIVGSGTAIDGFVAIISNNGASVIRSTYVGTNGADQIFGVQFDNKGFPYVMGQTTGTWPIQNATYGIPGGKQFIVKLQPDLSANIYSTAFGTGAATPNISPIAFLVDRCENVYISGWGGFFGSENTWLSAGTTGLPVTPDAIKSNTDGKDFYFFVLKKDATSQLFGSFFGENNVSPNQGSDHVDGGTSRFDRNGVIYQAICGNCNIGARGNYPVTTGAWSTSNNATGAGCNLTMVKIAMNLAGVGAGIQSAIDGTIDTAGCLPLPVIFTDTIANGVSYEWYFNYVPGNPPDRITTVPTTSFTYNAIGVYRAMLVAIDPATCNQRDSSFVNIRVGDLRANLLPAWQPIGPGCPKFTYQFINNSTNTGPGPFADTSFVWDFGDGSPLVPARIGPGNAVTHTYPALGTYLAKLILKDTSYCNNPDDSTFTISIADNVQAIIQTPSFGCVQYNAVFKNNTLNGVTYAWDFGDPSSPNNTSTALNPTHLYINPGVYTVRLTATNIGTCNVSHDTTVTITVLDSPVPDFTYAPNPPLENTPTTFTNLSSPDAVRFKWVFGDGDSLLTTSRAPIQHQYNATGTFTACLTAYNAADCDSTVCKDVSAIIVPLVDVPNAFTPQTNDINSVVMVRGFGIAKMQFIIWNRWGQKVFETNNRSQGWDGRVKGVVQPMDVYAYTLSVEFFDGKKVNKKGDITLIR